MILQTSIELDKSINENGCYFMSILYHASQKTAQSIPPYHIQRIKAYAIRNGFMDKECYVTNPDGIFKLAGLNTQYSGRHESPYYVCSRDEIEILYYRWGEFGHFVAGCDGGVLFDPKGVSNSVQLGTLESKRIFKVL